MTAQTHDLQQGSPEWKEHRATHLNASDAAAMLGISPYRTRNDLLVEHATGYQPDISPEQQRRFDEGHRLEEQARPKAEGIIGEELFPTVMSLEVDSLPLSASFDGATMTSGAIFEHKTLNEQLRSALKSDEIPEHYWPQMEQQLLISGAEKCLFMASNDNECLHAWYESDPVLRQKIISGWHQFLKDSANYEPPEDAQTTVGHAMESLPALRIEVTGMVTASNLAAYKDHALAVFGAINTDLQTDEDFATAENTVKWCSDVEGRLEAAKQHALSQTESIDQLFRTIDELKESARQKRLELDKLVKARKQAVRGEIRQAAELALAEHVRALEARIEPVRMPRPEADFAAAMHGKRTIKSLRDAVDQVLANAKIEANAKADAIQANLKTFDELVGEYKSLFPDLDQLAHKAPDDFAAAVKLRIADHKAAEEKRMEAERERIRAEEQAKAEQAAIAARDQEPGFQESTEALLAQAAGHDDTQKARDEFALSGKPPTDRSLDMQLSDWQQAHEISDQAFDELMKILKSYGLRLAA